MPPKKSSSRLPSRPTPNDHDRSRDGGPTESANPGQDYQQRDNRAEKLTQEGLKRLMKGKISFLIVHRLATIRDSHKIMIVKAGEIVEFDSHDNLMAKRGFYYSLYMSQFKGKAPAGADAATADFTSTKV